MVTMEMHLVSFHKAITVSSFLSWNNHDFNKKIDNRLCQQKTADTVIILLNSTSEFSNCKISWHETNYLVVTCSAADGWWWYDLWPHEYIKVPILYQ